MTFFSLFVSLAYLYLQRFFNNGVSRYAFSPQSLADYFYLFEFLLLTIAFLFARKRDYAFTKLFGVINLALIVFIEILRRINFFGELFLFGYPVQKIAIAVAFFILFSLLLFGILYLLSTIFIKKTSVLRTASVEFLVLIALLISSIYYDFSFSPDAEPKNKKYNYAVVFGAAVIGERPSPMLEGRLLKALELYRKKLAQKIILTGGAAPSEKSEGFISYRFLSDKGVPKNKMIFEEKTATTWEQVKYLKSIYDKEKATFVFVSDKFHLKRISEMAKFLRLPHGVVPSYGKVSLNKLSYYKFRDAVALLLFMFFAV